ncbi:MobC family plasmid mobilization relaxosome protein [Aquipuribacter hungaricus]|uniref:MobC family plasmid mobilization relaxosome protein n=1 Tax=Aquipuribacter hungaricus TaxID=545624 RepID=UPI00361C6D05
MSEPGSAGPAGPAGRLFARRRRANVVGGRQHRHEVKVTPEEEALLLQAALAQGVTVPRLLVEATLSSAVGETPTERRNAMVELFGIHRLLAAVSNNVNQIAKATNATGEVHEDLVQTLRAVRRTAERVDTAIDGLSPR